MDDQARLVIQGLAQVRAQIAAREVELKVMKTYVTPHNPDGQRLEEEIKGLKEQAGRLEAKGGGGNADALMPTGRMPQVGIDYLRKLRELRTNEALYEILLKEFEAAKLEEGKDVSVIQVVEQAVQPESRFKPKRKQMVILAFVVSLFVSSIGAFFLELIDRSRRNPENRKRLEEIWQLALFKRHK